MLDMQQTNLLSEREKRIKWFLEARFGMFIHWGIYSIPARGEWVQSIEKISKEKYMQYFYEFNPVKYEPRKWAKLAKRAGMKYAVFTAKHHDGFCLFDSKYTDFKSTNTLAKKDLVREYVESFRQEDLKVGLYYSLLDWYHDDYPAYGDRQHPMRDNESFRNKNHNFDRYIEYMHNQVRELMTNYGQIDILWFDFSYHHMKGEAWKATELVKMVRSLQPNIIINNRLGGDMSKSVPDFYAGDFANPEQYIPSECMKDENGNAIPWEANITLNNSWGYCSYDNNYKTAADVIRTLVNCVSKGGNLMVNVGPNAKGEIPEQAVNILLDIGKWMDSNEESIYGCGHAGLPKPEWGYYTAKDDKIYAHVFERVIGQICLKGLKDKIKKARVLSDGSEAILSDFWNADVERFDSEKDVFVNFANPVQYTYDLPDKIDTVIELTKEN